MKIEIGTLITIITISIGLGSSYYAITNKIDALEVKVKVIQKQVKSLRRDK